MVAVVIVHYKTVDLLIRCLNSLARSTIREQMKIIVVDNHSSPGIREELESALVANELEGEATIVYSPTNLGFGAGNNVGVEAITRDFAGIDSIFFLNPDTLVHPDTVSHLVDFLAANSDVGIVGSRIVNEQGNDQISAHPPMRVWYEFDQASKVNLFSWLFRTQYWGDIRERKSFSCGWVSGAGLMIRASLFHELCGFDPRFFLYFEEVDLCKRASEKGWEIAYCSESELIHIGGQATQIYRQEQRRTAYWYNSRRMYYFKHHQLSGLIMADLCFVTGALYYLCTRVFTSRTIRFHGPQKYCSDLLFGDLKAVFATRPHYTSENSASWKKSDL